MFRESAYDAVVTTGPTEITITVCSSRDEKEHLLGSSCSLAGEGRVGKSSILTQMGLERKQKKICVVEEFFMCYSVDSEKIKKTIEFLSVFYISICLSVCLSIIYTCIQQIPEIRIVCYMHVTRIKTASRRLWTSFALIGSLDIWWENAAIHTKNKG